VKRDGETLSITYLPDVTVRYLLGFNRSDSSSMEVESLISGMPLEEAGLQPGDVIVGMDGTEIADGEAYDAYIAEHPLSDKEVTITYERDGERYDAVIVPREYRSTSSGFGYNVACVAADGPVEVLKYGLIEVKYMIRTTILSLKELVTGHLGMEDLSGPVGVVDAIGETYEASKSEGTRMVWMNMLNMAVLLSANLGVMNLLPFPALDGGRLVFLLLEAIRRKPINRNVEASIHFTGLVLLMILMVFVMYNDLIKIF
jgi:regulator of sigma E protease